MLFSSSLTEPLYSVKSLTKPLYSVKIIAKSVSQIFYSCNVYQLETYLYILLKYVSVHYMAVKFNLTKMFGLYTNAPEIRTVSIHTKYQSNQCVLWLFNQHATTNRSLSFVMVLVFCSSEKLKE